MFYFHLPTRNLEPEFVIILIDKTDFIDCFECAMPDTQMYMFVSYMSELLDDDKFAGDSSFSDSNMAGNLW